MTTPSNLFGTKNDIFFGITNITPGKLKKIRKKYRMTLAQFSELLDVNYNTYCSWESGNRKPSSPAASLISIADKYPEVFLQNRKEIITAVIKYFSF